MEGSVRYVNRENNTLEVEKVFGGDFLRWMYRTSSGKLLAPYLCRKFFSQIYGFIQGLSWSVGKISPMIKEYNICVEDFMIRGDEEEIRKDYSSFNEFFSRRFRPGRRTFIADPTVFPAPVEGRYLAYSQWSEEIRFPVKGAFLTAQEILTDSRMAREFDGGPLLVARLCPVDYHRFHFPDAGRMMGTFRIEGGLHSVSPIALKEKQDIFMTNERQVSLLQTENFGKLAFVEVGAFCVGKIVQTFKNPESFYRGQEKGYFLFGGSTVIIFGQRGAFTLDQDLLDNTGKGLETLVKLGTRIGIK